MGFDPTLQMFFNQHDVAGIAIAPNSILICIRRIGLNRPVRHLAERSVASSPGGNRPAIGFPCRIRDPETELRRPAFPWPGVSVSRKIETTTGIGYGARPITVHFE